MDQYRVLAMDRPELWVIERSHHLYSRGVENLGQRTTFKACSVHRESKSAERAGYDVVLSEVYIGSLGMPVDTGRHTG
jgi:hypothetical protein